MTTIGAVSLVRSPRAVILTIPHGPAIAVDVVREVTPAGVVVHHVERYSRWGGPRVLVARDLTREADAVDIAHAEVGR